MFCPSRFRSGRETSFIRRLRFAGGTTAAIRVCPSSTSRCGWRPDRGRRAFDRHERRVPAPTTRSRPYNHGITGKAIASNASTSVDPHRSTTQTPNRGAAQFAGPLQQAGIGVCTIHDLRRSCITNWAAKLPIHIVQRLAGHSDIKTTQTYYLFVGDDETARARGVQSDLLGELPKPCATDPLLTHSAQNRCFPSKRGCPPKRKALD